MIREIAILTIDPAQTEDFEAAVHRAVPLFLSAEGCFSMHLEQVIEEPGRYRLVVEWDSVAAHTEVFRATPAFQEWRALAGPFFTEPPHVLHMRQLV